MDEKNINELDLSQVNQIDDEIDDSLLDDDSSFGQIKISDKPMISSDGREIKSKTGIILDFSDDNEEVNTFTPNNEFDMGEAGLKTIKANLTDDGVKVDSNFTSQAPEDYSGYNAIDMETDVIPDDYDGPVMGLGKTFDLSDEDPAEVHMNGNSFKSDKSYDDYMDELRNHGKELVDEDIIAEKKSKTTGEVEQDYWDKLQKKHAKTNVKGAYNTHFHISGDPEQEMKDFNHDMTPGKISSSPVDGESFAADGGSMTGADMGGFGESKQTKNPHKKLFEDLLVITGFELVPEDDCYTLKDCCGMCKDIKVNNPEESVVALKPYIDDSFIYPLQIATGEKFDNCADWVNWYTPEMQEKYPNIKSDIRYCDLVANHCKDFKF